MRRIGAHVSAAGGHHKSVARAIEIGADSLQFFSGSPRVWRRQPLADLPVDKFNSEIEKNSFGSVFTHALYLVNLASDNSDLLRKSVDGLVYDLSFDAAMHGSGVVVHVGSHQGRGWEAVKDQVVQQIAAIIEQTPDNSTFLIENSAGQNGKVNSDFAEIKWLLDQLQTKRVGWCFDTCHAFAAGYALGAESSKMAVVKPELQRAQSAWEAMQELDLFDALKVIHVNDSRDAYGSGRDRHQNLGQGLIPRADLKTFLSHSEIKTKPLILEVPGFDGKGPDAQNIDLLQRLLA